MSRVLFDAKTHRLEQYVFTFAQDGSPMKPDEEKPRECRMRFLIGGEPELGDTRRFRMLPEDAALVVGNAKKRLTTQPKGGIPMLYEHGWGMYGGKAGGYALDVYEEGGDIWFLSLLDEHAWEGAVDPGLNWFGRSAGFSGWMDPDGFIRPADIFEGSFTNFPAMKGLGTVEPMAQLEQRLSSRSFVAMNGLLVPNHLAAGTPAAPLGLTQNAAPGGGEPVTNPSPSTASTGKEQETMKLSATTLKLLGFAEDAEPTEEQIETAMQARVKTPATVADQPLSRGDVSAMLAEFREQDRATLTDQLNAEFAERERAREIETVILEAERDGRATAAERDDLRKDGKLLGPERLKAQLAKRAPNAPTRRVFVPGEESATFSAGSPAPGVPVDLNTLCAQASANFRRPRVELYARQRGISLEAAAAELGVN